jgi:hypothetical protein
MPGSMADARRTHVDLDQSLRPSSLIGAHSVWIALKRPVLRGMRRVEGGTFHTGDDSATAYREPAVPSTGTTLRQSHSRLDHPQVFAGFHF